MTATTIDAANAHRVIQTTNCGKCLRIALLTIWPDWFGLPSWPKGVLHCGHQPSVLAELLERTVGSMHAADCELTPTAPAV